MDDFALRAAARALTLVRIGASVLSDTGLGLVFKAAATRLFTLPAEFSCSTTTDFGTGFSVADLSWAIFAFSNPDEEEVGPSRASKEAAARLFFSSKSAFLARN